MTSIIPFFQNRGFDTEATKALGKAYDIACRSLHPKDRVPTMQDFSRRKLLNRHRWVSVILTDSPPSH
jgi:hypothetical protein